MNIIEFERKIDEILAPIKPQKELTFGESDEEIKNYDSWVFYNSLLREYSLFGKTLIVLRQFITSKEMDKNWYDIISAFQYSYKDVNFFDCNLGDVCHSIKAEIKKYIINQQEYNIAFAKTIAHFILNELSLNFVSFMDEKSCQRHIKLSLLCQQAWLTI